MSAADVSDLDVAVIGMAGRFPGARSVSELWQNLRRGVEGVARLGEEELVAAGVDADLLKDPGYVPAASVLADAEMFDAEFFDYSPREAELMDPQGRVFLECAWEALEDAGYDPFRHPGRIGLFAGQSAGTYLLHNARHTLDFRSFVLTNPNIRAILGNNADFLTTRVAYKLDLKGPAVSVATACSTSLVAVHLARQSLLTGECEMALAGAASIYLPQGEGYLYEEGSLLSPDGHCRVFDAGARGTVFGRGAGVVVLKPLTEALEDGDRVLAVIKGSAINNDGAERAGFTAPGVSGQARVIAEAHAVAGVHPDTVGYVEAHGTGTRQGDPIEVAALTQAFRLHSDRSGYCALGSVKSNLGHLDAAAGMAGLIKTVLMLRDGELAPTLNFETPNPQIDFESSPFYVNTSLKPWPRGETPRRAGVSSFGLGGTNAHIVLEEPPGREDGRPGEAWPAHVLTLSARTPEALHALGERYRTALRELEPGLLADLCYTSQIGRAGFSYRLAVVGASPQEVDAGLDAWEQGEITPRVRCLDEVHGSTGPLGVAFLSTGQGAQHPNMGRELYESLPVFREVMDRCLGAMEPDALDPPLGEVLYPAAGREEWAEAYLRRAAYAQPAQFALGCALASTWRDWGVEPSVVVGHSAGEYVAACVAGVFSPEDGMRLVAARGRLMEGTDEGTMVVVRAGEEEIAQLVREAVEQGGRVAVAAVNGPENVVVSGEPSAVARVTDTLAARGREVTPLAIPLAAHSPLMESMLPAFAEVAAGVHYASPRLQVVSNVTGREVGDELATPAYWLRHTREPVRFAQGLARAGELGCGVYVELGARPVLLGMGQANDPTSTALWLPSLRPDYGDWIQMLESLAAYWVRGGEVDWAALHRPHRRRRVSVPTYPFQRRRFWIAPEDSRPSSNGALVSGRDTSHPLLGRAAETAVPLYESKIDLERVPFLTDHKVGGTAILPGTAFLEIALAAALDRFRGSDTTLEDVVFERPMVFEEGRSRVVQVVLEGDGDDAFRFQVFGDSGVGGDQERERSRWIRHAHGTMASRSGASEARRDAPDLADVRRRCGEEVDAAAYYDSLRRRGIDLGPRFQGIHRLHRGEGEALAEIRIGEDLAVDAERYRLHPAVLDAAVQALLAAAGSGASDEDAYLPMAVGRLRAEGADLLRGATTLWGHAVVTSSDAEAGLVSGAVRLRDDEGRLVAELSDVQLRRTRACDVAPAREDVWYELDWTPSPEPSPALSAAVGADTERWLGALEEDLDAVRERCGLSVYEALEPELDRACAGFMVSALRELGWEPEPGDQFGLEGLGRALGVLPRHERLLGRMLDVLAEEGFLRRREQGFEAVRRLEDPTGTGPEDRPARPAPEPGAGGPATVASLLERFPSASAELTLVARCGPALAAVLCGEVDPLDLLFPGGSLDDVEALYRDAPFTRAYNEMVRDAFARVVESLGPEGRLRVLEVGAGTGGTASWVLPVLPPERTEYLFTDVSPLFLDRSARRLAEYPFVSYRPFDVERHPAEQAIPLGGFDVVLATQVLHATTDLRRTLSHLRATLAPGGLLVLIEGTGPQRWVDMVFGLTEGWWKFRDTGIRPAHPLLPPERWCEILSQEGFRDSRAVPGPERSGDLFHQTVILSRAPSPSGADAAPGRWMILADEGGIAAAVASHLEEAGDRCVLVHRGATFEVCDERTFRIDPADPDDFRRLLATASGGPAAWKGAVHLWACDAEAAEEMSAADLVQAQLPGTAGALYLARAWLTEVRDGLPRLWIATRRAQAVEGGEAVEGLPQAMLWGLGRTIAHEHPELRCTLVDLGAGDPSAVAASLVGEMLADAHGEDQIALRDGSRWVPRLRRASPPRERRGPTRLEIRERGAVENLLHVPLLRRRPGPGEVEIRVSATGLNFRDVLNVLGLYPGDPGPLGRECCGTITAVGPRVEHVSVGEQVIAMAPGSFATYVTTDAGLLMRKPEGLSPAEAATLLGAYLTAWYGLHELAEVTDRDAVLVHSGAGGVGLAAVRLALRAGARVFATAGSPAKRAFLEELGVEAAMDSRSLHFAGEILERTEGRGVDVVVNSLSGDSVEASMSAVARGGRFVELGKVDVWDEKRVRRARPDVRFRQMDLEADLARDPVLARRLLGELEARFADGALPPLPHTAFAAGEVVEAFRFMARARHIGKIVVLGDATEENARSRLLRADATYLVAGGLGGLGLLVGRWMADNGAGRVALMGRSEPSDAARRAIAEMEKAGADVIVVRGDVARAADVARALEEISNAGPLRGVVQAAGVLDDGVLLQQDWSRFRTLMDAKVAGSWNLHRATLDHDLDFFVLFSSAAALLALPGQANHAAVNAFEDALAHYRAARRLPALAVDWGSWSEVGATAARDLLDRMAARGIDTLTPAEGIGALERCLRSGDTVPQRVVAAVDWGTFLATYGEGRIPPVFSQLASQRPARTREKPSRGNGIAREIARSPSARARVLLSDYIRGRAARTLGVDPASIDATQPLNALGLDSLMAVELRSVLAAGLSLESVLPATLLFDHPTIEALTDRLARDLGVADEGADGKSNPPGSGADVVADVEALSEEEAEAALLNELTLEQVTER